jgi:hypothetical protein
MILDVGPPDTAIRSEGDSGNMLLGFDHRLEGSNSYQKSLVQRKNAPKESEMQTIMHSDDGVRNVKSQLVFIVPLYARFAWRVLTRKHKSEIGLTLLIYRSSYFLQILKRELTLSAPATLAVR